MWGSLPLLPKHSPHLFGQTASAPDLNEVDNKLEGDNQTLTHLDVSLVTS